MEAKEYILFKRIRRRNT